MKLLIIGTKVSFWPNDKSIFAKSLKLKSLCMQQLNIFVGNLMYIFSAYFFFFFFWGGGGGGGVVHM